MTTVHRLIVYVVDDGEWAHRDVAAAIRSIPDLYPIILQHDIRTLMPDDDIPERERLTPEKLEAWFYRNRPPKPTIQTVVSVIQAAPPDTPGRTWLEENVLPLLLDGRLETVVLDCVSQQPEHAFSEEAMPLLVRIVCDLVRQIIDDQGPDI
jgi:hypothetical protein